MDMTKPKSKTVVIKDEDIEVIPRKARSPEEREKQMINLAVDLAEKQLRDGTAAPSVINHYLKLASRRETIEREILEKQKLLLEAKTGAIDSNKNTEKLYAEALEAMRQYSGK